MEKTIVTRYNLKEKYSDIFQKLGMEHESPIRIALVSDVHDRNPGQTIQILRKEKPDLICIPGDLFERCKTGAIMADGTVSPWTLEKMDESQGKPKTQRFLYNVAETLFGGHKYITDPEEFTAHQKKRGIYEKYGYHLIAEASKIAPVVYSCGNHEWYLSQKDMKIFRKCHVEYVDNRDIFLTLPCGVKLHIGGFPTRGEIEWLKQFSEEKGDFKILLMHHPEYYDRYVKDIDHFHLIMSGHAHGGQWRIFGHGIFAPNQGLFPKYHHGIYPINGADGSLIVSAGCANTLNVPRYGNPKEVVIIEI